MFASRPVDVREIPVSAPRRPPRQSSPRWFHPAPQWGDERAFASALERAADENRRVLGDARRVAAWLLNER